MRELSAGSGRSVACHFCEKLQNEKFDSKQNKDFINIEKIDAGR